MIKRILHRLRWSLKYDYIFLFQIPELKLQEKVLFIAAKYFFYLKDVLFGLRKTPAAVKVLNRTFYYNDAYGLTSLQRVYCEHYGLKKWVGINPLIVDVGAHIGQFNFFCSHYLHARRVISIEPLKDCYELLKLNAMDALDCNNEALSVGTTNVIMHISKTSSQLSTYVVNADDTYSGQFTSPAETLDILTDRLALGNIDILKIDTEGSEYDILSSGQCTLEKVRVVIVEMSILRDSTGSIFKTGELLEQHRFLLREIDCFQAINPVMANGVFERDNRPAMTYQPDIVRDTY